jgi:L-cysteine S-thiosulfotransferase
MRGVAARYPVFDPASGRPMTLGSRIGQCITQRQLAPLPAHENARRLGLEALVALQSRGQALRPDPDARLSPMAERGGALYRMRIGQINLSCAQCHDERAGQRLAGVPIVQGHANGYPAYRLEWQALGSLQRRIRNCMTGVRAEPLAYGSEDMIALELHLARRSAGLPVETPSVRP